MITVIARRLIASLPVLLGVVTISFFLLALVPGDPVDVMLGEQASNTDKEALRKALLLDRPLGERYVLYLEDLAHFDLGISLTDKKPIGQLVRQRFGATFELAMAALAIASLLGIPFGVWAALKRDKTADHVFRVVSLVGASAPSFWIAPTLVYIFALKLDLLPVNERGGVANLILPSITLAFGLSAVLIQITRASMLEVLREDYIATARAKGAPLWRVYFYHALANAANPVVSVLALQAGAVLTGTVIVESIFDWPGIGTLLFQSIQRRDFPVVQGCVLTIAVITMLVQLLADLVLMALDPRTRLA
ncbi:MAG: ABC transporter permease [Bdellovibrionota bacterium]